MDSLNFDLTRLTSEGCHGLATYRLVCPNQTMPPFQTDKLPCQRAFHQPSQNMSRLLFGFKNVLETGHKMPFGESETRPQIKQIVASSNIRIYYLYIYIIVYVNLVLLLRNVFVHALQDEPSVGSTSHTIHKKMVFLLYGSSHAH